MFLAVLAGVVGAAIWLVAAFLVAYPEQAMSFTITPVADVFFSGQLRAFIPLLLLVDMFIGGVLIRDREMDSAMRHKWSFGLMLVAALTYIFVSYLVPQFRPNLLEKNKILLFMVVFVALGIVRTISYIRIGTMEHVDRLKKVDAT